MLWTWTELLQATGGNLHGPVPGEGVSGISIDTRTLHAGDLFIALAGDPGPRFTATTRSDRDGHDFLPAAFRAGAPAALVANATSLLEHPGVVVADTLDALWAMARHRRAQLSATVVAVTGSSGKTTTKSLLAAALRAWAEPGSLNNHLGVPLSISRTPSATQTAVYEIGTNHPGEIAPLSRLARPQVAIVLNVHPAHIGNFRNIGDLTQEKLSIADGLVAGGVLVREVSLPSVSRADIREVTFGTDRNALIRLDGIEGDRATYSISGRSLAAHIPGGGEHRARSLAAVLATLVALDRDPEAACVLSDELVPAGRGGRSLAGGITVVDDSYNANPGSMTASIRSFSASYGDRSYAVIGEMLELGDDSDSYHLGLAPDLARLKGFWAVGEGMRVLAKVPNCLGWKLEADDTLCNDVVATVRSGDALLIKGRNRIFWANRFAPRLIELLADAGA